MVPQQSPQATETPEHPAAPTDDGERPTLNAGVIWLDSPLDPVESGSGANNYGYYDNSRLVDIVARAGDVSDLDQRKEIACDALAVVTDESAFLPVAHVYMVYGVSEQVTDFEPHPTSLYFFDHRIGLAK